MNKYFHTIALGLLFSMLLSLGACEDKSSTISFLILGDSHTIGESISHWPVLLADSLCSHNFSVDNPKGYLSFLFPIMMYSFETGKNPDQITEELR